MKRFSLITEIEARVLDYGSTVELEPGGRVTPLAADTLKERRVTVRPALGLTEVEILALAPPAEIRTVAVGTDHSGLVLKKALVAHLRSRALDVIDLGTDTPDPVDYPDVAARVAAAVARGDAQAGVVIDGAGIGSAMVANKVPGIRAALCYDISSAQNSREHNHANVLTLGAGLIGPQLARQIVKAWLDTAWASGRHARRVEKIMQIEQRYLKG